jgi:hypothetical protein
VGEERSETLRGMLVAPMGAARRITVDGVRYLWTRAHRHNVDVSGQYRCRETVIAWPSSHRRATLVVRFADGDSGGHTTAGGGWGGAEGVVLLDGCWINLNRPAVVAALIRSARALGWRTAGTRRRVIADGFAFVRANPVPTGVL